MHKKIANIVKKYAKFFVKKHKNKYGKIITDLQHKNLLREVKEFFS